MSGLNKMYLRILVKMLQIHMRCVLIKVQSAHIYVLIMQVKKFYTQLLYLNYSNDSLAPDMDSDGHT